MDFKIAVEPSKLAQVIAYTHEVEEADMKRLLHHVSQVCF